MTLALLLLPLLVMLCVAAATDLRTRRIPNALTLTIAFTGVAASVLWPMPLAHWWQSLIGLAVGLLINIPLFLLQIRGGGDVKLFAGVGAWIGPWPVIAVFVIATVVAMFVAILQAALNRRLKPVLSNTAHLAIEIARGNGMATDEQGTIRSADRHLPYAVPIALAVGGLMFL